VTPKIDLHIHTTASDGKFSPQEIVEKAARLGLTTIAITDHDTVDGIVPALEAARVFPQLEVIPGIEISTFAPGNEVHVLGYFIDFNDPKLKTTLADSRNSRQERAKAIIAKLNNLNVNINWQQVQKIAGSGTVGRPHIAQAMLNKGYIKTFKEAFTKYIGLGGPAYVERHKIIPAEAVTIIKEADGLPVLAHPFTIKEPEGMIAELKSAGLVGIEVYYNDYNEEERNILAKLASKYNLIATGGSDYHGLDDSTETMLGDANVHQESARQLIAMAQENKLKPAGLKYF
jgi:predicted metal-dependent phosphoesterase TrpH